MEYKMAALNLDFIHRSLIDLVRNAIEGEATSIAVRINVELHRIQIIDNAIGFSLNILRNIGEHTSKKSCFDLNNSSNDHYYYSCHHNYHKIIKSIAKLLIITTQYENTNECYEKIIKNGFLSTIQRVSSRPAQGTTLTIYFLDNLLENNFYPTIFINSINHLAKHYPQISFSIRDDNKQEIILQIKKQFKNQPKKKNYELKSTNLFIFSSISNAEKKLSNNSTNHDNKSFFKFTFNSTTAANKLPTTINKSQFQSLKINEIVPSQWSDWNLESPINISNETRRYRFLPAKLTTLLPLNINNKLVNRKMTQEFNTCGVFNYFNCLPRRQDLNVRPCNKIKKLQQFEITLERDALKHMEVLNQINLEFIAATVSQNGSKLLILIDQHAMHERIRYENLLEGYKNDENQFKSVRLNRVIKITDIPTNICELILKNDQLFINFGLELQHDSTTNPIIIIKAIPKCFLRKKIFSLINLISIVRKLLLEIIDKLINGIGFNNLPSTIHNEIASEACHGAIKFGDPLNFNQCNVIVDYWKQTNLPNRCAHGRPVIIPLLSIDNK